MLKYNWVIKLNVKYLSVNMANSGRFKKPGREAYTLLDKPFFYGLGAVSEALSSEGIKHALYGGVSLQAYFAHKIAGTNSIDSDPKLASYLRQTGDYDLAVTRCLGPRQLFRALDRLHGNYKDFPEGTFGLTVARRGEKRTHIEITKLAADSEQTADVMVTFFNEDDRHQDMITDAKPIHLVYGNLDLDVPTAPIESTVAGKLSRAGAKRDIPDIMNVIEVFPEIDLNRVGDILSGISKTEPHVRKMVRRVRSGRESFLNYLKEVKEASSG